MTRFTFFGGKGGVGKTTCAAAAAVRAAREGARVLVVSTDPAHSLGDALDVRLRAEPSRVALRTHRSGALYGAQLNADRALSRWLGQREPAFRAIAERGTYLDEEDIDRVLGLSLPGAFEIIGLFELLRLARVREWTEIVVDTAPTGHTLRLLEMPDTLGRFAEILDDMHAKHRFLATSIGGAWRPDFADDVIRGIERDARDLRALLTNMQSTYFTWVTLPEELSIAESLDAVFAIEQLGVDVARIVVNRVWPVPERPCPSCTPRVSEEARALERLRATLGAVRPVLTVPAATIEPRGVGELERVAWSVRSLARDRARSRAVVDPPIRPPRLSSEPGAPSPSKLFPPTVKLALFGGKGGVGKTTAACAAALEIARAGKKRVLLLSTDPAPSLGDALATPIGDEVRSVPGAPKSLRARELDARAEFEKERERYRRAIDDLFASIFRGRVDATFDHAVLEDLLDLAPPGIDELFAIVSFLDALFPNDRGRSRRSEPAPRSDWDLVVVDTAPTGHTLRLLELPEQALEWVHAIMAVILKYRSVIGLGEIASDLTTLARRLRALIALLRDPARCAFVVVTRPSELPRVETRRLVQALGRLHISVTAVLANAVTALAECTRCERAARIEGPEIVRLRAIARRAKAPLLVAPAVFPTPRGPTALASFRASWRTETAARL